MDNKIELISPLSEFITILTDNKNLALELYKLFPKRNIIYREIVPLPEGRDYSDALGHFYVVH